MLERLLGGVFAAMLVTGLFILTVPEPNFGTLMATIGAAYMGGLLGALVDNTR